MERCTVLMDQETLGDEETHHTHIPVDVRRIGDNRPEDGEPYYAYGPVDTRRSLDTRRWRDLLCSWTSKINIVKVSILPKHSTDLLQSP